MNEKNILICSDCGEEIKDNDYFELSNGDIICRNCYEENYFTCADCGEIFHNDCAVETGDGDIVCESCADENYFYCEHCNQLHPIDEAVETSDTHEYYCEDCAQNYLYYCEDCERYFADESYVIRTADGSIICESCYQDNYFTCADCGEVYHNDFACEGEDGDWYCENCYNEASHLIMGYHAHKYDFEFQSTKRDTGKQPLYFGFELEVENKKRIVENNDMAQKIEDIMQGLVVFEHDGSLCDGFEIISQPMTKNFIVDNKEKFEKMLQVLRDNGFASHDTTTCGLHIHMTRAYFTENEIDKLNLIIERFKNELVRFSRRTDEQLHHWAKFITDRHATEPLAPLDTKYIKNYKDKYDRYYALNLTNKNTIEFRLLRGTLKTNTFFASLQLLNNMARIAKIKSENDILKMTFKDVITFSKNTNELKTYCIEKNLIEEV